MNKGASIRLIADFASETMQAIRQYDDMFKILKEKNVNQEFYIQQDYPL